MPNPSAWPDDRVDELRRMWAEGLSSLEIATALGVSKNTVIGKAYRIGLAARPSPVPLSAAVEAKRRATRAKKRVSDTFTKVGACQWPFGHPGEKGFHFCGDPVAHGRPYCSTHAAKAYVSSSASRRI